MGGNKTLSVSYEQRAQLMSLFDEYESNTCVAATMEPVTQSNSIAITNS